MNEKELRKALKKIELPKWHHVKINKIRIRKKHTFTTDKDTFEVKLYLSLPDTDAAKERKTPSMFSEKMTVYIPSDLSVEEAQETFIRELATLMVHEFAECIYVDGVKAIHPHSFVGKKRDRMIRVFKPLSKKYGLELDR